MSRQTESRLDEEFELSNRQLHRLSDQLGKAISNSGINQIGQSRFELKAQFSENSSGSHDLNGKIGITSYASMDKFQSQMSMFGKFCFNSGISNLNQIKPSNVSDFLNALCEHNYAKNTVQSYASAIEKFAVVMDRVNPIATPRTDTWHAAVDGCRERIGECEMKDTESRAYSDPNALIGALESPQMQMVATMQLHYGLRIADATKVKIGNVKDGVLLVDRSKNGQNLEVKLRPDDLIRMKELVAEYGTLHVKQDDYRDALKQACYDSGQEWNGTHGLRHNFAQNRLAELVGEGMDYHSARGAVSEELGHHRPEITDVYLR